MAEIRKKGGHYHKEGKKCCKKVDVRRGGWAVRAVRAVRSANVRRCEDENHNLHPNPHDTPQISNQTTHQACIVNPRFYDFQP